MKQRRRAWVPACVETGPGRATTKAARRDAVGGAGVVAGMVGGWPGQ